MASWKRCSERCAWPVGRKWNLSEAEPLRDALRLAAARLAGAGFEDGRKEALALWAGVRRLGPGAALLESRTEATRERLAVFVDLVERRTAGEPLAYVTGWTGFRRLTLATDRRALIPRPETEGLVDLVLREGPAGRVADIGTGSGCIALSLADEGRYDVVVGIDRSFPALALARANTVATGLEVRYFQGDLTAPLGDASCEVVVSNPPYLTAEEYATADPSVAAWEPAMALVSGEDGMETIERLLDDGRRVLVPGGLLALEVDSTRAAAVAGRALALGWEAVAVTQDLFGRDRYVSGRRRDDG